MGHLHERYVSRAQDLLSVFLLSILSPTLALTQVLLVSIATRIYASSALKTGEITEVPFIVTANDVTHGKPHPEPYLKGMEGEQLPTVLVPCPRR